jgi:hypothetical protein
MVPLPLFTIQQPIDLFVFAFVVVTNAIGNAKNVMDL